MTGFYDSTRRPRLVAILTAWLFLFAAEGAIAKNNGNSDHHFKKSAESGIREINKDQGKSRDKSAEKNKKQKDKEKTADKDKEKRPVKEKPPVIISGGYVRDKLPNGTEYNRRATKDELDKAAKANGSATSDTGPIVRDHRPPAAPAGGTGPVVRDHRQGGTVTRKAKAAELQRLANKVKALNILGKFHIEGN
jgi:hypothetical protein